MKPILLLLFVYLPAFAGNAWGQEIENTNTTKLWAEKIEWQQQKEPEKYKIFATTFKEIFNSDDLSQILNHSSDTLLNRTDPDKLVGFLNFFKSDQGNIESMRFKYFDSKKQRGETEELAVYYLEFENESMWELRLGVNDSLQMTRYIITDNNYNEDLLLQKNQTSLELPFKSQAGPEEWYVLWGGLTQENNYHVTSRSQKNAIDFIIKHPWSNKSYKTDGKANEDYYAFEQPIYSPAQGEVVKVIDGVEDNVPGKMNPKQLTGNTVIIKTDQDEYLLLAHFKNHSVKVKQGDYVEKGTLLGLCGNSGNSSEPHLHMHVMDAPTLKEGTGLQMFFDELIINGESQAKNYSPVRGNTVSSKQPTDHKK